MNVFFCQNNEMVTLSAPIAHPGALKTMLSLRVCEEAACDENDMNNC
jgi:hypothetical protein